MKDLFNDDIFEQATDSEIMESAVCSCILEEINSKFETCCRRRLIFEDL